MLLNILIGSLVLEEFILHTHVFQTSTFMALKYFFHIDYMIWKVFDDQTSYKSNAFM